MSEEDNKKMGIHIILDLFDCPSKNLERVDFVKKICLETTEYASLSILKEHFHQFLPAGVTGSLLLKESHLHVHTWPEHNSVAIDVFCCFLNKDNVETAKVKAEKTCDFLIRKFEAKRILKNVCIR